MRHRSNVGDASEKPQLKLQSQFNLDTTNYEVIDFHWKCRNNFHDGFQYFTFGGFTVERILSAKFCPLTAPFPFRRTAAPLALSSDALVDVHTGKFG